MMDSKPSLEVARSVLVKVGTEQLINVRLNRGLSDTDAKSLARFAVWLRFGPHLPYISIRVNQ